MFRNLPPVTKNLLIINFIVFFADFVFGRYGIDLTHFLGLHYITASEFHFWQPLTYMFMHADFSHIFFNMFAVLMFGPAIEDRWGSRRFLIYYLITGLGAALVQESVWALRLQSLLSQMEPLTAAYFANKVITIGASGAVFGILLAERLRQGYAVRHQAEQDLLPAHGQPAADEGSRADAVLRPYRPVLRLQLPLRQLSGECPDPRLPRHQGADRDHVQR